MKRSDKTISEKKLTIILLSIIASVVIIAVLAAFFVRLGLDNNGVNSSLTSSEINSQITSSESGLSSSITQVESDELVYESDDGTNFSVPDELRAVYLKPGKDFLLKTTDSVEAIKKQIDSALDSTKKLGFNSVVIFTETAQGVLFDDGYLKAARSDLDVVEYVISAAKSRNMFSYVVYPTLIQNIDGKNKPVADFSNGTMEIIKKRAAAFAKKYQPSAIVLDNYTTAKTETLELFYRSSKSSKTLEDFLREQVTLAVRNTRNEIRKNNNVSQCGFFASSVWANASNNSNGSQTDADFQSYVNGFADTRDWVLNEKFNFVMVENLMPTDSVRNNFSTIAKWWSSLCSQTNIAFYNIHASSKLSTALGEFSSPDQLIRQVSVLKPLKAYGGSVFDSLSALLEDKDGSTTLLQKYFNDQLENSLVFSKLKMSSPAKNSVTTYESSIVFSGATDPNFKILFNGKPVEVTEKGYFSFDVDLVIGSNKFEVSHKGKTVTYTVTRKVKLLESVAPSGTIEVDGGTKITLSAVGYTGSKITAKVGNTTVNLIEQKPEQSGDGAISSQYVKFEGTYTAPASTSSVQNLGSVTYSASWSGFSESMKGATIKVFAKPVVSNGKTAIQIIELHAETFPTDRLNDQSQPYCYPLPAGTVDFIVGNELSYTQGSETFKYYKLQSGHRVYSKDLKVLGKIEQQPNKISSVDIDFDGRFVNLNVQNSWNVPFRYIEEPVNYSSDGTTLKTDYQITKITYRIFYTDYIDKTKITLDKNNPLISAVDCTLKTVKVDSIDIPVCDIVLTLRTSGGFFGASPYYKDGNLLNVRLNAAAPIQTATNSYGYTLNGATIVIDAGHDPLSPGTVGILQNPTTGEKKYTEYVLNAAVRENVVSILKELGANVITIDNTVYRYAVDRLAYFKKVNPHIMISIHHNAATASSAKGPVGVYFNSYSQLLSKYVTKSVKKNYISTGSNRASDYGFARLSMTREQYYPSMIIECGFMSNIKQLEELIVPENQQKIAKQIVAGMIDYFVATGSLNYELLGTFNDNSGSGGNTSSDTTSSSIAQPETSDTVAFYEDKKLLIA